jgi:NADPH-dependent curcumin reductase CurA
MTVTNAYRFDVITMRLVIKGFIVTDFTSDFPQIVGELVKATKEGKIKVGEENETVVETKFEDIPKTWARLFDGGNRGKLVTKIV